LVKNIEFLANSLASPGNSEMLATEIFYLDIFFLSCVLYSQIIFYFIYYITADNR